MRVVIDSNIVISSLIKNSVSRHLIAFLDVSFYYPEQALDEIIRNKNEILEKGKISEQEFAGTFATLFKYIKLIKKEELQYHIKEADKIIGNIHKNDVVFIATALAKNAIIWSNDHHFQKQNRIFVITTNDIIENYRKLVEKWTKTQ